MTVKMILSAFALMLAACSYGSGDADQMKRQEQVFQDKLDTFSSIEGIHNGELATASEKIPVQVMIFHARLKDGKTSENLAPVLQLRYRQLDRVRTDVVMDAFYSQETGRLVAAYSVNGAPSFTFEGNVSGNSISGTLTKSNGPYGFLTLKKFSAQTTFSKDADTDLMDRLQEKYKEVQGTYVGDVLDKNGESLFKIEIKVFYVAVVGDTGTSVGLKATYILAKDPDAVRKLLNVDYRTDFDPPTLFMSTSEGTKPSGDGGPRVDSSFMSIGAVIKGNMLTGQIIDYRGPLGEKFVAYKLK